MQFEIHLLQSFPPANLNRDENGMPKSTVFGGRPRARISSQCQKRAVRQFYHQYSELDPAQFAHRSRAWMPELKALLEEKGIVPELAESAARLALGVLGAEFKEGKVESNMIFFLGKAEIAAIADILIKNWAVIEPGLGGKNPEFPKDPNIKKVIEKTLVASGKPGDVALFGRMMASLPTVNVDAAVQVAHAIGVNALQQEFDFFTAVDDLGASDDAGADHMGETGYNSSTYYRFTTLDTQQLLQNLGDDTHLEAVITAFAQAFIRAIPTGHQNAFAAHSLPAVIFCVVRQGQPISLADAFEKPIRPDQFSLLENALTALDSHWKGFIGIYGDQDVQYRGIVVLPKLTERLMALKSYQEETVETLLTKAVTAALGGN
ncbi:MAG: type I-E CRISPR-associated protein Cas7/Cse4/CasC [Snowella sp.]|nr:type I-E CRISPR-associated protein Cas7/Cse4/CasC [Snowella sp.]